MRGGCVEMGGFFTGVKFHRRRGGTQNTERSLGEYEVVRGCGCMPLAGVRERGDSRGRRLKEPAAKGDRRRYLPFFTPRSRAIRPVSMTVLAPAKAGKKRMAATTAPAPLIHGFRLSS